MFLVSNIYKILLDALFPISKSEQELFSLLPENAYDKLPRAPSFTNLAISREDSENMKSIFAYKDERVTKLIWNIKYKKSDYAIKIGGYALWRELILAGMESRVCLDTPLSRARDTASSPSPSLSPKCPTNSLSTPAPTTSNSATTLIIPMPITNQRRKERGYNQCELLIDEIEKLDINHQYKIDKNLLIRIQNSSRQTLKNRLDRMQSAKDLFAINEKIKSNIDLSQYRAVIIVDDVITTGSTMNEAICTLKKSGINNVWAISLAH